MYNRSRYLQKLGIQQNPAVIQQQLEEQQRLQEQQKKEREQQLYNEQLQQQQKENVSLKNNVQVKCRENSEQTKIIIQQGEPLSQITNLETESYQKKLTFDDDLLKYLDNPVILDEKEESTADDDDDDRINDLQNEDHTTSIRKQRFQLSQSFTNKEGDFLINYYIKDNSQKIRQKYINKLISNKILRQEPSKKHQTSTPFQSQCLKEASSYGETFIITNAAQGWVEYSSKNFMPTVHRILEELKIKVISARTLYESQYPNQCHQWKVEAFKDIKKHFDKQIITNLICLGDSHIEIEAAHILAKEFDQSFIKTVKFKEQPRIEELIKQQDLVRDKLEQIYTNFKNLTIRLEKKQTPKEAPKK